MIENEMGYRGSKSGKYPVKEQRVDGSWINYKISNSILRYTLMGGESRYPIKIPSNQIIIKKNYYCSNQKKKSNFFFTLFCHWVFRR